MSERPSSVVAERAVRYLYSSGKPASSIRLARELLSLTVADEEQATVVLRAAFVGDPRLLYDDGAWRQAPRESVPQPATLEPDVAFVLVVGQRVAPRAPFGMTAVA